MRVLRHHCSLYCVRSAVPSSSIPDPDSPPLSTRLRPAFISVHFLLSRSFIFLSSNHHKSSKRGNIDASWIPLSPSFRAPISFSLDNTDPRLNRSCWNRHKCTTLLWLPECWDRPVSPLHRLQVPRPHRPPQKTPSRTFMAAAGPSPPAGQVPY